MNQIERALLLALISMIFLFVLALPVIAGAAVFLPINKYNLAIVTPLILVTSIALVMWLKFICFVLAYISGVTKIGSQVARAIDPR
ncbi:hypothetical protein D3C85_1614430 [compost metagenome]